MAKRQKTIWEEFVCSCKQLSKLTVPSEVLVLLALLAVIIALIKI